MILHLSLLDRSNAYYAKAIDEGRIQVNDQLVKRDYKVKHGDIIQHSVHRHEPPVLNRKIKIIQKDDKLLIVDKPASLPVHPTGRYCHNTLVNILKYEHPQEDEILIWLHSSRYQGTDWCFESERPDWSFESK